MMNHSASSMRVAAPLPRQFERSLDAVNLRELFDEREEDPRNNEAKAAEQKQKQCEGRAAELREQNDELIEKQKQCERRALNQNYDTTSSVSLQARSDKPSKPLFSIGKQQCDNNKSGIFQAHMTYKLTKLGITKIANSIRVQAKSEGIDII